MEDDKSYSQSPETVSAPYGSLTPFEQFKQRNPDLQVIEIWTLAVYVFDKMIVECVSCC